MTIINGDCLDILKTYPNNHFTSIITDPPYGLSFMGKKWDYEVPSIEIWKECLRVLKPGGTALIFAGSRTQHRMACNVEDAGFILKDCLMWLYGSGFPKATDISKQFQKNGLESDSFNGYKSHGLKPAYEPILLAMKPNEGSYAQNALKWGVSGINIDKARVEYIGKTDPRTFNGSWKTDKCAKNIYCGGYEGADQTVSNQGRFPSNIILDEEAGKMLDKQSGFSRSRPDERNENSNTGSSGIYQGGWKRKPNFVNDKGGASRFYFKVEKDDSFMYNNVKEEVLCGLEKTKEEGTFAGKKKENKKENLSIDGFGNSITVKFQKDSISITKTETNSIMKFPILTVSTNINIGTCIIESEKTIEWLKELNIESVNAVENGYLLIVFNQEQQVLIKATVKIVPNENFKNGEKRIKNITTNIIENIERPNLRFKYCAKASKSERNGSTHPTVKPLKLMEYLINLIMPPKDGLLLDPFAGSGSTIVAATSLDYDSIGIELEEEYCEIAHKRVIYERSKPKQMKMDL